MYGGLNDSNHSPTLSEASSRESISDDPSDPVPCAIGVIGGLWVEEAEMEGETSPEGGSSVGRSIIAGEGRLDVGTSDDGRVFCSSFA